MTLQIQHSWEYRLVTWAQEALQSQTTCHRTPPDRFVLEAAHAQCDAITRHHSRTFFMASALLPEEKKRATRALYAFCRITDDIVDSTESTEVRLAKLTSWKHQIMSERPPANDLIALAWADARVRYNIPSGYAEQLIEGVTRDLNQTRYDTFEELADYAYGVASTVGLMAMHIVGFSGEEALPYAVKLGVALQITNILRDIAEDFQAGRLYLPQVELQQFNLTEADLRRGQVNDRWRAFMRFQIARNHQLYTESIQGISKLDGDGRFAIAAAAELYRAILFDIERNDYDVFTRRAHVGLTSKLSRLPGIWLKSRRSHIA